MMWKLPCALSFPYLLAATAFVLPPSGNGPLQAAFQVRSDLDSDQGWNLQYLPPNPNSTHNLIFNSVSDLLHRWPNFLRRNGVSDFFSSYLM